MKYLSICSGIEAATVAWEPLGWSPLAFAEIDKFPSAVLNHRWPNVNNLGDLLNYGQWNDMQPDIIVGGTPCQSFSVAGLRKGLADDRGNITLKYIRVAERYRPTWLVWENVPGVLSDRTGAFGSFLGGLAELGYGFAYRVLDAQYYGVPQRRKRVFVVGYLGDWRRAAAVLFECQSLSGDSPPIQKAGQNITGTLNARTTGGGGLGTDFDLNRGLIAQTLLAKSNSSHDPTMETYVTHTLRGEGHDASEDGTGRGVPLVPFDTTQITSADNRSNPHAGDPCHPLAAGAHPPAIAFDPQGAGNQGALGANASTFGSIGTTKVPGVMTLAMRGRGGESRLEVRQDGVSNAVLTPGGGRGGIGVGAIAAGKFVRRLTPIECERLQGFPDDHTRIPWKGKGEGKCPDGPRYKAIGNSMAVPVMRWIGERIAMCEMKDSEKGRYFMINSENPPASDPGE